ncbi:hypothetical protein EDB81DRAFT_887521 [Dactylonectria macrodidyma]|uniref:Heterokaryon incompatibility domain-containing protein n=1 Tax=Dactylonectria macrodidyma TaxID=307937 RepID=A0A9P9E9T9_9HYPO|nr:hypothetical protein EDB81DRAFT_887521 [Dactylonectria macrodidyma]
MEDDEEALSGLTSLLDIGSDNGPSPGSGNIGHTSVTLKCPTCRDLQRASIPKSPTGEPLSGDEALRAMGFLPPPGYVEVRPAVFGQLTYHDYYFIKSWTPPWPRATTWIKSAIEGCRGCQIVVEGASSFCPGWFEDVSKSPDALEHDLCENKIILAMAKRLDGPLLVWLVDTNEPWLNRRNICLEIFTHPDHPRCWPTVGSAEPVAFHLGDAQSIRTMKRWIKTCCDTHDECRKPEPDFMPTRLLELHRKEGKVQARLVEGSFNPQQPYVALSYCWGTIRSEPHFLKTTKDTLEQHRQALPLDKMPLGIRHILDIVLNLDYKYLWVDSLCIIQGDAADWNAEAGNMTHVYANAHLVIGNNRNYECVDSLLEHQQFACTHFTNVFDIPSGDKYCPKFMARPVQTSDSRNPYISDGNTLPQMIPADHNYENPKAYVRIIPEILHGMLPGMPRMWPLRARGWTLQENLLATRFLDLCSNEMNWKCVQLNQCECGGTFTPKKSLSIVGNTQLCDDKCLSILLDKTVKLNPKNSLVTYTTWMSILGQYSGRSLTFGRDALIAIMGLEKAFKAVIERMTGGDAWNFCNGVPGHHPDHPDQAVHFLLWRRDRDETDATSITTRTSQWPHTAQAFTLPLSHKHFALARGRATVPDLYYDMEMIIREVHNRQVITGDSYVFPLDKPITNPRFPSWHFIGSCARKQIGGNPYCFNFLLLEGSLALGTEVKGFNSSVQIDEMVMGDISILDSDAISANMASSKVSDPHLKGFIGHIPGGKPVQGHITLSGPIFRVRLRTVTMQKSKLTDDGQPFSLHTVLRGAIEQELNVTLHHLRTPDDEVLEFVPDARHIAFGKLDEMRDVFPCTAMIKDCILTERNHLLKTAKNGPTKHANSQTDSTFSQFHGHLTQKDSLFWDMGMKAGPHKVVEWPGFPPLEPEVSYHLGDETPNVSSLWPCYRSDRGTKFCPDLTCRCRKGWIGEDDDYPAYALKMGEYVMERTDGFRAICMAYMVLTRCAQPNNTDPFSRIGLGYTMMYPKEPGYQDPFRHARNYKITIV